jgi:predicted AAA+ superfamily ATPase
LGKNEYLGSLVETFVYSELIKHASYSQERVKIYHYRDQNKKEVDFVIESRSGDIVAIEIKSGSNLKKEHFKGLIDLAKRSKNKSFKGVMLYSGDKILPYKIDEHQFWAIPLKMFL